MISLKDVKYEMWNQTGKSDKKILTGDENLSGMKVVKKLVINKTKSGYLV